MPNPSFMRYPPLLSVCLSWHLAFAAGGVNSRSCASSFGAEHQFLRVRYQTAVSLSAAAHGGMSYGDLPFLKHLHRVTEILTDHGYDPLTSEFENTLFILARLHDYYEDTPGTPRDLQDYFSEDIIFLITMLTNLHPRPNESDGAARRRTYIRLSRYPEARIVKLADRIANVEDSVRHASKGQYHYLLLYTGEWAGFRNALFVKNAGVRELRLQETLTALMHRALDMRARM